MSGTHHLKRLHSLDALRAAMMLLGLVLHSAASYTTTKLSAWPYQDAKTSGLFDWIVFIIHLFRMPTFFVMAGFFAAFLYHREGPRGFLAHRTRRLLLPLAAAWVIVFPLAKSGVVYVVSGGGSTGLEPALGFLSTTPYVKPTLIHLWFIYDLMIFCLAAVVIVPLVDRLPAAFRARIVAAFGNIAPTLAGCLAFGMLSAMTMIPMKAPALDTSVSFLPLPRVLVAYSVFFSFGWLLFTRRDLVPSFGRHAWRYFGAGLVMAVVYMIVKLRPPFADVLQSHLAGVAAAGVAMWLLIYGLTGLFVRYFESPRSLVRYLSDGCYWMYLIHLPFTIWIPGLLAPLAIPALAKFLLVLGGTTFVTVTTYHYFVRATAIGAFLNGRRFERALPQLGHVTGIATKPLTE